MGTHLYVCDNGGPMVIGMDGTPSPWVTCPVCEGLECERCEGARLQGAAQEFAGGARAAYRCPAGHEKTLRVPDGKDRPESAQCTECDGMLLPVG